MGGGGGRVIKQIIETEQQLAGRLTSWLFTKRGRGFEQRITPKQLQASGQRGDSNLGPPDYEPALVNTRPRRLPLEFLN